MVESDSNVIPFPGCTGQLPPRRRVRRPRASRPTSGHAIERAERRLRSAVAVLDLLSPLVAGRDGTELLGRLHDGSLSAAVGELRDRLDQVARALGRLPRVVAS